MNEYSEIAERWIDAGLEYFTLTGKVELNKISQKIRLSKSSFYNIFSPENGKKPLEVYYDDILAKLDYRLDQIFAQGEAVIFNSPVPDSYRSGIKIIMDNFVVYRSLGVLASMPHDIKASNIYEKSQARLLPMIKHLVSEMYPGISSTLLTATATGLMFGGTLFMLRDPSLKAFAEFSYQRYDELYEASPLRKKHN